MKVLLARPHDFLVDSMRAWVGALQLEPVRLKSLDELASHAAAGVAAVVISAAVTSAVKESPGATLVAVRRLFPQTPVLVAGLASLTSARAGLASDFPGATLHGPGEAAAWGEPATLLYVSAEELRARAPALDAATRRHLRLATPA